MLFQFRRKNPMSLLNVMSKICGKIVFKYHYNYFKEIFILPMFQSSFQTSMFTVTHLMGVYHQYYTAVDDNEIMEVFLNISKALDNVWYKGIKV